MSRFVKEGIEHEETGHLTNSVSRDVTVFVKQRC
jgi:hypothetical protein